MARIGIENGIIPFIDPVLRPKNLQNGPEEIREECYTLSNIAHRNKGIYGPQVLLS